MRDARRSSGTKIVKDEFEITEDLAHQRQGRSEWARHSQGSSLPRLSALARHVTGELPEDEDFEGRAKIIGDKIAKDEIEITEDRAHRRQGRLE